VRQFRFTALVMLDPAARDQAARCGRGGPLASCLVEPSRYTYFPAVIETGPARLARPGTHALITAALHDSEAGAFFAPGQRFTIWADALVGETVRADGLLGYGLICQCVSLPAPRVHLDRSSGAGQARLAAVPAALGA
jgi:hypothetical protein